MTQLSANTISQIKGIFREVIQAESSSFPMCIRMDGRMSTVETHNEEQKKKIEKLEQRIKGNGDDGIETRLTQHDEQIATLIQFMEEMKGYFKWGVLFMLGTFLTALVNLIMNHVP